MFFDPRCRRDNPYKNTFAASFRLTPQDRGCLLVYIFLLNPCSAHTIFSARGGVQAELNREVRRFDDRPDIAAHLLHLHDAVPGHRLQGPGQVAAAPSRRRFQFLQRFRFPLQDGLQQQLVLVAEDLRHGLQ